MLIKTGELKPDPYKGIRIMAAWRLHEDIFNLIEPYLRPGMKVLDFGCGEGAFSQRLIDAGMIVDGCDIDTGQVKADLRNKITIDLNKEVNQEDFPEKYDVLIAMEILEHLQNPWKYISDCRSLIADDGLIVLSTPNISSFVSRLRFLMRGSLTAFEKPDFVHGHITPLSFIQLENMFDKLGLEIVLKGHAGPIPLIHLSGLSLFSLLRNTLLPLLYPFMTGPKRGRALVYILKKKA